MPGYRLERAAICLLQKISRYTKMISTTGRRYQNG